MNVVIYLHSSLSQWTFWICVVSLDCVPWFLSLCLPRIIAVVFTVLLLSSHFFLWLVFSTDRLDQCSSLVVRPLHQWNVNKIKWSVGPAWRQTLCPFGTLAFGQFITCNSDFYNGECPNQVMHWIDHWRQTSHRSGRIVLDQAEVQCTHPFLLFSDATDLFRPSPTRADAPKMRREISFSGQPNNLWLP